MLIKDLDVELPISLEHIQPIIDRIHLRYPILNKYEIVIIVNSFFKIVRSLMVSGDTLSINGLFPHMKLLEFNKIRKNKFSRIVKVKLSTPRKMKNA